MPSSSVFALTSLGLSCLSRFEEGVVLRWPGLPGCSSRETERLCRQAIAGSDEQRLERNSVRPSGSRMLAGSRFLWPGNQSRGQ